MPPKVEPQDTCVSTRCLRRIERAADFAFRRRQVFAFSGRTGIGKTRAVAYLNEALTVPHILLRCRAITTRGEILDALASYFGIPRWTSGRYISNSRLYPLLGARLRDERTLIIFDEADRLQDPTFELLRDFYDEYQLAILLVGNEGLEAKIDLQLERLARRIHRWREPDLKKEEMREIGDRKGWRLSDEEFDLLWKTCGGSPGWWEALIMVAEDVAERNRVARDARAILTAINEVPKARKRWSADK